jgi:hypothetical protein
MGCFGRGKQRFSYSLRGGDSTFSKSRPCDFSVNMGKAYDFFSDVYGFMDFNRNTLPLFYLSLGSYFYPHFRRGLFF